MSPQGRGYASSSELLRGYFFERYFEMFGARAAVRGFLSPDDKLGDSPDPFAEQFVELQVDTYLNSMDRKLQSMKRGVVALESIRREVLSRPSPPSDSLRERFKRFAAQVEDDANGLHDMVSAVVNFSERERPSKIEGMSYSDDFFGPEVDFLASQVSRAEVELKDMFLEPSNVVTVDELRSDNVLTELRSIERVSKEIRQGR